VAVVMTTTIRSDEPIAVALITAIRGGDVDALAALLGERPELASVFLQGNRGARAPLQVVTDWPGFFPNGPRIARMLLDAGADPDVVSPGEGFKETPLHWAASSDDADVAEMLIDGGADLEAPGGSIAGTPLANAVGYGCWAVAQLLVARGARVDVLWQAAALGLLARVEELAATATPDELNHAFWQACHGGRRRVVEYLLGRGADLHWRPDYAPQSALEIAESRDTQRENLVQFLRERGADSTCATRR
jgi:uncharacterized protein